MNKDENQHEINPELMPSPGIEPGPHWKEASILTTVPKKVHCIIDYKEKISSVGKFKY